MFVRYVLILINIWTSLVIALLCSTNIYHILVFTYKIMKKLTPMLTYLTHIRRHFRCLRFCGSGLKTALTASSKTCFSPRWVRAEHSIYLTALILFANFWPCSLLIGLNPWSARALRVSLSSLKSIFVPKSNYLNANTEISIQRPKNWKHYYENWNQTFVKQF